MTTETPDTEQAIAMLHRLIQPLIPHDPSGIKIHAKGNELTVFATNRNMGALIGRNGSMATAIRQILMPFGWRFEIANGARETAHTAQLAVMPDPRTIVAEWLEARYGATTYQLEITPDDREWVVVVHPDHYTEDDHTALDTWAWCAARAQGDFFKVRLRPGGLARLDRA